MANPRNLSSLQAKVWNGSIPLEIRLASSDCRNYDESDPYLVMCPRLSYIPLLLPRLHAFFSPFLIDPDVAPSKGWLSFEDVPLKWHYPVGLLFDLYSGIDPATAPDPNEPNPEPQPSLSPRDLEAESAVLPWRLTIRYTEWPSKQLIKLDDNGKVMHDAFINSVKEADFLRNGTAKVVMSLSKDDSTQLWTSVQKMNLEGFNAINQKLLNPRGSNLRHIPIKLYLPHAAPDSEEGAPAPGTVRVVQAIVKPLISNRQAQTLGTALKSILPTLFQSTRRPMLAQPVLHGAAVPLSANVHDLLRAAAYADGWLHVVGEIDLVHYIDYL
ncbi:autophagy protein-like protein 5 [Mytilinidion resinicola]|uniref:Autophagy protein 5 n=1 Tax=Mytilinidion resinicola TaxID=574789 RepID=A0A6A6YPU7_9PEZI|nr:autophagy protein-like protein 5 [Mytilinidion resinicola]KAF2810044.1 autophagy protein-like protein 5 [Mytilinidion resinicola]